MFRFIAILRHGKNIAMNYHGEWETKWTWHHAKAVGKWVALHWHKENERIIRDDSLRNFTSGSNRIDNF